MDDLDAPTLHEHITLGELGVRGPDRLALLLAFCGLPGPSVELPTETAGVEITEAVMLDEEVVTQITLDNVDEAVCFIIRQDDSFGVVAIDEIPVSRRKLH
jgi:hypothetical protein